MKEKLIPVLEVGICGLALYGLSFLGIPNFSKKQKEEAEKYGGTDIDDWWEFEEKNKGNKLSCDKGSHKKRSIANGPNHLKHWKKKKNKFYGKI